MRARSTTPQRFPPRLHPTRGCAPSQAEAPNTAQVQASAATGPDGCVRAAAGHPPTGTRASLALQREREPRRPHWAYNPPSQGGRDAPATSTHNAPKPALAGAPTRHTPSACAHARRAFRRAAAGAAVAGAAATAEDAPEATGDAPGHAPRLIGGSRGSVPSRCPSDAVRLASFFAAMPHQSAAAAAMLRSCRCRSHAAPAAMLLPMPRCSRCHATAMQLPCCWHAAAESLPWPSRQNACSKRVSRQPTMPEQKHTTRTDSQKGEKHGGKRQQRADKTRTCVNIKTPAACRPALCVVFTSPCKLSLRKNQA